MSGSRADLLRKATSEQAAQARLAAAQSKAAAAAFREQAAAEQAAAAASRTAAAASKAATAAIGTETAATRAASAAARLAAASSAQRAAAARADAAAIGIEAAASRNVAAGFNAEAAQSRAAAAASRAYIAESRAAALAMENQVTASMRLAAAFGAVQRAASGMGSALRAAGGGIGNIISGFTAMGAAGYNGAKRAGDAITTFIVRSANVATAAVGRLTGALRRMGSGTISVIRGLGTAMGILTSAFGIFALTQAVKFQEQLAIINTVSRFGEEQTLALGRALRNLAVDKGLRLDDLTAAYYEFGSAGIATGLQFDKLKESGELLSIQNKIIASTADLSIGGLSSMTEATKLMSFALNAYNLNQIKISAGVAKEAGITADNVGDASRQIADYFAKSVEIGVVKASEIASTFATVAASAKVAGIGLDEVAAAYAQQTRRGVSAARVAVSMNRAIQDLMQPSKRLRELQKQLGVSFLDIAREKGIGVAFQLMRKEADRLGISYRDLFKRQEGWRFALNMTGKDAEDYETTLKRVRESVKERSFIGGQWFTGTAQIQAAIRGDTVSRNIIRLQESFRSLGITIGYWFLAPLNEVIKSITSVITFTDRWLDSLDNAGKDVARQAAGLIGLVGAILALGAGLQGFLLISSKIAPMFGATATGARALQVGIRALALPLALIVGFIGTLAFTIQNNVAGMGRFAYALAGMQDLAAGLMDILRTFIGVIGATMTALSTGGDAAAVFSEGIAKVGQMIEDIGPLFAGVMTFIVQAFFAFAGEVIAALGRAAPAVAAWAVGVGETILRGLLSVVPAILRWAADVAATVGPALIELGRNLFSWISTAVQNAGPYLAAATLLFIDWVRSVAQSVLPALGRFAGQVVAWLGDLVTDIAPGLLAMTAAFVGWVADVVRAVVPALVQLGRDIVGWLMDLAGEIAPALAYLSGYLVGWISQAVPKAVAAIGQFFREVVANIGAAAPGIFAALVALGEIFVEWVASLVPQIVGALGDLAGEIAQWVADAAPGIAAALTSWAASFVDWFASDAFPAVLRGLEQLVDSIAKWLSSGQVIRQLTNTLLSWWAAFALGMAALFAGIAAYLAGHLPEILGFLADTFGQVVNGIVDFLIQKGPLIAGAALLLAANFIANLVGGILRDPLKIVGAIGSLMSSAVVLGAIVLAGAAAGALYTRSMAAGAAIGRALAGAWRVAVLSAALGAQLIASGIQSSAAYARAVAAGQALVSALGAVWSSLTGAIAAKVTAAGLATGGLFGRAVAAGTSAVQMATAFWSKMLVTLLPGATATGAAIGAAIGTALLGAVALAAAAMVLIIENAWDEQQRQIAGRVAETIARANRQELLANKAALEQGIADLTWKYRSPGGDFAGTQTLLGAFGMGLPGQIADLKKQLDAVNVAISKLDATAGQSTWMEGIKSGLREFDPGTITSDFQRGIDAGAAGLDFSGTFSGLPAALDTSIEDAKATLSRGWGELRANIASGTGSLEETTATLRGMKLVSDKTRLGEMRKQLAAVEAKLQQATKVGDTKNKVILEDMQADLQNQIKDLEYGSKHWKDLEEASKKANVAISTTMVTTEADLKLKTAAIQTAGADTIAAYDALIAAGRSVPIPPPIPAPTITPPANLETTAVLPYSGVRTKMEAAIGTESPITGPTVVPPGGKGGGTGAVPVPTAYQLFKERLTKDFETTITLPAPKTGTATQAVQTYVTNVKSAMDRVPPDAMDAANRAVTNISAAFKAPTAITAATSLVKGVINAFSGFSLFSGGAALIQSWLNGLNSKREAARSTAWWFAATLKGPMAGESPPKEGPLRNIDLGGANVINAWVGGMLSQMPSVFGAANQLALAAVPSGAWAGAGFMGQREAFMVPSGEGNYSTEGMGSVETERLLRQMLAALGLNNELTAAGVRSRPRAITTVGAMGVIGEAKAASGGRI